MNYLVHFLMSEWMEMSVPLVYTVNYWSTNLIYTKCRIIVDLNVECIQVDE